MIRKDTHDQGTTKGHPLFGRPRDNQRTPRDTPGRKPSKTAPLQRSDQGTTNRQPTDSTRRPTKGQISPLYRGRLSPGHEFQTQKTINACPGQTGHPKSKITTATHTGQAVAPSGESPTCKPHRHRQAAFGGRPTPFGSSKPASKPPSPLAAEHIRTQP